jgi:hypothetical protein
MDVKEGLLGGKNQWQVEGKGKMVWDKEDSSILHLYI